MSKTNSNSMTGLLIYALNNEDSEFRSEMFKYFTEQIRGNIPEKTVFYDGTHQPLLYKEMNGKEIDIIAREPGKRKPVLMIEVKAGLWENLQESQCEGGEYQKTVEKYGIPLVYIIPRYYAHESEIPENATKIEWEVILSIARKYDKYLTKQIENFVEISEDDEPLSNAEIALLTVPSLFKKVSDVKDKVHKEINCLLKKEKRKVDKKQPVENQFESGYWYHYKNQSLFIGFNPCRDDEYFLSLCIKEDSSTDKDDRLHYEDGYYYVPVDCEITDGDKKVLEGLRTALKDKHIVVNTKSFTESLSSFYTLKARIKNLTAGYVKSMNAKRPCPEDDGGLGYYFGEADEYFLGLSLETMTLILEIKQDLVDAEKCKNLTQEGQFYNLPLCDCKYADYFNEFILSSSGEELQKNFNKLVNAAMKEADKYLKA